MSFVSSAINTTTGCIIQVKYCFFLETCEAWKVYVWITIPSTTCYLTSECMDILAQFCIMLIVNLITGFNVFYYVFVTFS